ncbi:hypothetical protein ACQ4PT_015703 [Festuca glaucescens]
MTFAPDPSTEPVSPRTNTQGDQEEGRHHRSADPFDSPPPLLTAFTSVGASPEAEWEDDVAAAADSEDEAEWATAAAAAAAELEDEAKWECAAAAESEDDAEGEADTGEPDSPLPLLPSNSALKAELFPRLEAACEARRLQEDRLLKRSAPPAGAGDPDDRPPKSRHWRRFRELSATKSSLANPVLNPDENSLSLPPSNKSKEMLSDKVADQGDDTTRSSKSTSYQIVPYENGHEENSLTVPAKKIKYSIDTYAVQCGKCWKWRLIPTKIKYDEIREKSRHVPFLCEHVHGWKPGVSCDDPADISQDDGFWAIDRPCIYQTPPGWERTISIRSEGCSTFADVYYYPPSGKKLRSKIDVENYLRDNPDRAVGLDKSQFSFTIPERLQDYVRRCRRHSKHRCQSKRRRQSKPLEPNKVLPLSSVAPIHEDLAPNCLLPVYDEGQYCM